MRYGPGGTSKLCIGAVRRGDMSKAHLHETCSSSDAETFTVRPLRGGRGGSGYQIGERGSLCSSLPGPVRGADHLLESRILVRLALTCTTQVIAAIHLPVPLTPKPTSELGPYRVVATGLVHAPKLPPRYEQLGQGR